MVELYISKQGYPTKQDIKYWSLAFKYVQLFDEDPRESLINASLNGYTILPGLFEYELSPRTLFRDGNGNERDGASLSSNLDATFKVKNRWRGSQIFYLDIDKASISPEQFIQNLKYKPTGGYTTFSHNPTEGKNCFRLMYLFDRVLNRDEWTGASTFLFNQAMNDNPDVVLDRASLKGVQSMNGTGGASNLLCNDGPIYNFEQLGCPPIECPIELPFDSVKWIRLNGYYGRRNGDSVTGTDFLNVLFAKKTTQTSDGIHHEEDIYCTGQMLHDIVGTDDLSGKLRRYYNNFKNPDNEDMDYCMKEDGSFDWLWIPVEINGETHYYQEIDKQYYRTLWLPERVGSKNMFRNPNNHNEMNEKCQPGWNRHKWLSGWALQLRRIKPSMRPDELIYNLIWLIDERINRGTGADAITSNAVVDIANWAYTLDWEAILQMTEWWDERCIASNEKRNFITRRYYVVNITGNKINYSGTLEDRKKRIQFRQLVRRFFNEGLCTRYNRIEDYVNSNYSGDWNNEAISVPQMANELNIPVKTLYKDFHDKGVDLKTEERRKVAYEHTKNKRNRPNKLTDEEFLELYDPELSNQGNIDKINEWGEKKIIKISISLATFKRYKNRLISQSKGGS